MNKPTSLLGPDGGPLLGSDGMLLPHARSFASVLNAVSRTYSYRWDEAVRDNPTNALAMRRDVYIRSLLQERQAPTINLGWQLEVDNDADPRQKEVCRGLTRIVRATPRFPRLKANLLEALWYGRYGVQLRWLRDQLGWRVSGHVPVNGDKIQYQWDGTPVIALGVEEAMSISRGDPQAVTWTDRGYFALRLYKPEWRDRFAIHTHTVDDADYFEGEMAGSVHGVGLRSIVYWGNWLRTEVLNWMLTFMESVGMMDLFIFNYTDGNAAAQKAAETNAKKISGKLALAVPRDGREKFPAVETVPANTAGIEALHRLIDTYFDRHIERLFVGQSMSAGSDSESGLGGSGRAALARDTKSHLLEWDAANLDETLTTDLIEPAKRFNYPWADFPVRFRSSIPDPESDKKIKNGQVLVGMGVPVRADDLRRAAGFVRPGEGEEVAGNGLLSP